MKKKLVLSAVAVVLVAAVAVGGSLAYFTDTGAATNTFTVGNISIDLLESQYHRVNAGEGNATGRTEPASGGYLWAANVSLDGTLENTPDAADSGWDRGYFSDKQIKDDAAEYAGGYFAEKSANMVPGSNVRKNPYVVNTGSTAAYVRVRVRVPVSLFTVIDNGPSYWVSIAMKNGCVVSDAVNYYNEHNYTVSDDYKVAVDGVEYYEFDFTYTKALEPDEMTFWSCWSNIAIDKNATAADLEGVTSFDVIVEADAIQADGFADAQSAFAAFDAPAESV